MKDIQIEMTSGVYNGELIAFEYTPIPKLTDGYINIIDKTNIKNETFKDFKSSHSEDYWNGFDFACDLLDEMYANSHPHKYNIADCLKSKVNRLDNSKIRLTNNKQNK